MPHALRRLLRFWASLDGPVNRRTYLLHGLALAALKYAGDVTLVGLATGRFWTPADYLQSVYSLISTQFSGAPSWLLPALGAWTLPFLWLGVTLTLRRALDAGRSGWLAFAFFVPYVNYGLMAVLATLPTAATEPTERVSQRDDSMMPAAIVSISAGAALGVVALAMVLTFRLSYPAALFFGTPFAMGALTGFLLNRRHDASTGATMSVASTMFLVTAGAMLLLATEGLICILMAMPLALITGLSGSVLGRSIAVGHRQMPPAFLALLVLPLSAALEPAGAGRLTHEVRSSVEITAPPEHVWPHVVAFRPIAEPTELLFRLGLAYPQSARIDGTGVGAVRYCVFSTGAFIEPITRWETARRLSFDVASQPAPLRELTIYESVSPPHLAGSLRSRRGEFRLVRLPGGRTRLEGSTWYELEMAPEGYWQVLSDYIIQRVHRRVLDHIKREVEGRHVRD